MAEPRIADDYSFIAQRLRELERPKAKWAVWYTAGNIWTNLTPGHMARKAGDEYPVSLFESEEEARGVIDAIADNGPTKRCMEPRIYDPTEL